jgi:alkanesulfonate monooxygenase SsuD/methylene tetrahydromethanopterin reductase-like flavin-dependent oxidoreductase (luciferase family)
MKVSLAGAIRNNPGNVRPLQQIYDEFCELAERAEELGFHRIWLSEHHLAEDGWNCAPMLVLAALARRTRRIRLGTYVMLLPLHHPLKVAEEVATLDILSGGRFDLAVGAGPMEVECRAFGINRSETFGRCYEALAVIQRLLTEDVVTHHGKYFHFDEVAMTTKPVQKPHPPIFTTPLMGPQSLEKSAQRGYNVASALHYPDWKHYEALLAKYGHDRSKLTIASGPLFVQVADSREQAFDQAEEAMHWAIEFYRRRGTPFPLAPIGEFRKPENAFAYGCPIIAGSPTEVLEGLSRYRDEPLDELGLQLNHPGMDHKLAMRSLERFAAEVLPVVSCW